MTTDATKPKQDVYEIITSRIIEQLEKGKIPWRQTWAESGFPCNLISKKNYRGVNIWLLLSLGYKQNYFLTFKQVKAAGGNIKQGEKASPVVFWNWPEPKETDPVGTKSKPMLRYYLVFNIEQCEDMPENLLPDSSELVTENTPLETCDLIVEQMPKRPTIKFKENRAYYHPLFDFINMPKIGSFEDSEAYYDTLFHELVHSTGHKTRLDRKEMVQQAAMGGDEYSIEELVAEIGACYLNSFCGMTLKNFSNNVAYIEGWLSKLKSDKRFIIYASGLAQKAVDFILNIAPAEQEVLQDETAHD
ncbi:MAG: zincin-like metallopeptidase domain-containing protein [Bacteroidota bacterium]|nr:zincin-like metallopeptidase domain-containing protein [Bacteroidota bacterium]